jgi:NAD(P)-dependent dehydrogenase (short-subunit alcohol dehydrogenase family)
VVTCARRPVEGSPYEFHPCDVRDDDAVAAMVDAIVDRHGRLDVAVNNAGGSPYVLTADASARFNREVIALNLFGPLSVSQHANTYMQSQPQGGAIVNVGSVNGRRPTPGTAAYGAAKAGVESITATLAVEWAPKVRINSVVVGMVETGTIGAVLRRRRLHRGHIGERAVGAAGHAHRCWLGRSVFGLGRGVLHQRRESRGAWGWGTAPLSRDDDRNQVRRNGRWVCSTAAWSS